MKTTTTTASRIFRAPGTHPLTGCPTNDLLRTQSHAPHRVKGTHARERGSAKREREWEVLESEGGGTRLSPNNVSVRKTHNSVELTQTQLMLGTHIACKEWPSLSGCGKICVEVRTLRLKRPSDMDRKWNKVYGERSWLQCQYRIRGYLGCNRFQWK